MYLSFHKFKHLIPGILFLLFGTLPSTARNSSSGGYSVYIFANMEGCSSLTNRDQILSNEGSRRMEKLLLGDN
jgi:hypothetical protein